MNLFKIRIEKDAVGGQIGRTAERWVPAVPRIGDFIYLKGEDDCYVVTEVGFHFNETEECTILVWVKN